MKDERKMNYTLPEDYFSRMEDKVRERIHAAENKSSLRDAKPGFGVIKPALLLVCMFLIIFGIGYGTMALTGTLGYEKPSALVADSGIENQDGPDDETDIDEDEYIGYLSSTMTTAAIESFIAENL